MHLIKNKLRESVASVLPIAAIVIVVLIVKFLGWAKKKNNAASLKVGRKKYWEELIYAFHLVFHPFDGF